jgi:hypothetical protein
MPSHIPVQNQSAEASVPVRRRNPQGSETVAISASIPKELHQKINGILVNTAQSRSRVLSELIADGFAHREKKGR